jgi:hypothetical protein
VLTALERYYFLGYEGIEVAMRVSEVSFNDLLIDLYESGSKSELSSVAYITEALYNAECEEEWPLPGDISYKHLRSNFLLWWFSSLRKHFAKVEDML